MGIAAGTISDKFAIDISTASFGVFVLFENDATGSLGKEESIAVFIPRTRRMDRIVVSGRKPPEGTEIGRASCRERV